MKRSHRALAALMALTACADEQAQERQPPRPVAWTEVQALETAATRTLSGVLQSAQRAPLSFEVPGRISAIAVEIGDSFKAGDVLARLDPRNYRLALEERRSQLEEAQANLEEAERQFERQEELFERGWVSRSVYDTALARLETAASRVETAQTRLAIAKEDLADTDLRAPYAGSVAARLAEPSQQVTAGQTVFEIRGAAGGLEVSLSAPETLVDRLRRDAAHQVDVPARPDLDLRARIAEIGSEATTRNAFPVTLMLSNAPEDLRTGMTAEVTFQLDELPGADVDFTADAVAIPVTAFLSGEGDRNYAFLYDRDTETLRRTEIEIVDLTGDRAIVRSGLAAGDIIATKGLSFLMDGQEVTLLGLGVARYNR